MEIIKKYTEKLFIGGFFFLAVLLSALVDVPTPTDVVQPSGEEFLGVSNFPDSGWYMVNTFQGYQTKIDPQKIPTGANPAGQNTTVENGDRVSVRQYGYEVVGTGVDTADPITSLHTFRKRNGDNILMRSRGTYLEYFDETAQEWSSLRDNGVDGARYGYADYNINTDLRSYVYFGNATDDFARWTGATTQLSSALSIGDPTISVTDAFDFFATGTVRLCDTDLVYTSKTDTTITLASNSTIDCASGKPIAQAIEEFPSNPKGNLYINANNRIFIAGVTSTPQAVYFSKYGDAETYLTTLVSDSTADAAGIFNLGEGGGGVIGFALDEGSIYIFKKSIIYKATLSDSLYTLEPLKPFDGKSQTVGAVDEDLIFTGGNGVYFVSAEGEVMNLTRVDNVDYPQIIPISDIIKPTTDNIVFDNGAGISFKDRAFFSARSGEDITTNDTILVWNDRVGVWDSPLIGWSASAFTIYDNGEGEELYFGDATTANVYKVIRDDYLDNGFPFTASWSSKLFTFNDAGIPESYMSEMNNVYVEGYISENTTLNITLNLDEGGVTQSFTTQISGTDSEYIFDATPVNVFGRHPFGYLPFGTSDGVNKKKFRVYLNKDFRAYPFYTAQLEFVSETENSYWEITSFGFKVRQATQPEKRSIFKSFN